MSYALAYSPYNTNLFMRGRNSAVYLAAELKDRVIADGGTFEAESCLINQLTNLSEIYVDEESLPFAEYLAATGITGPTEVVAIYNLMAGLQQDGLWSKMKAVYPFVTDNKNLLSYTNTLTNAYWQKSSVTLTSSQLDPEGGTNATKIDATALATNAYLYGTASPTVVGQTYTASVYIKGDASGSVSFRVDSGGSAPSNPVNYTTSWQRFTYTFVAGFTSADWVIGGYNTWTGSETIYVYAPQLELGSTPTTYQPIATTQQAYIANQFKYNLKDPRDLDAAFRLVFNGGWTHSSNGATPNGTNGYADTKLVANTAMNFNSQSFSDYLGTNPAASTVCQFGSFGGTPFSGVSLFVRDGYNGMNDNILSPTMTTSTATGYFILNRNNENTKKLFRNGSSIGSTSSTATNLSNGSIFIGTANVNSNPNYYSTAQHRFFSAGDGLTNTEAANLYTRVQAFQTSLSRNI